MSHSAPINVSEEVVNQFRKSAEGSVGDRYFQLQIKDESVEFLKSGGGNGSAMNDFNSLKDLVKANEGYYFLFKIATKQWLLITYVPEELAVKERMIYASAKATLLDKLGAHLFVEEIHITSLDELNYDNYQTSKKPVEARSDFEIQHQQVLKEEEAARKEAVDQIVSKESSGSHGTHTVTIPLSSNAKSDIEKFKNNEINFIALSIEESSINCLISKKVLSDADAVKEIHTVDPRFYLYRQTGKQPVFIYCCPEKSPPKQRMVYSTAKSNVINQITQLGVSLSTKRVEISDGSDLLDELKDATSNRFSVKTTSANMTGRLIQPAPGSHLPDLGGTVKSTKTPTVSGSQQHKVYGLMASKGNMEGATTKKKIVMPPPAAWYG